MNDLKNALLLNIMEQQIKSPKKKIEPIIPPKEHVYLDGPKSRGYELEFAWKVFWEFIMGFRNLHFVGPCITSSVQPGLKRTMNIIYVQENLANA
jgi:hypothetical protein